MILCRYYLQKGFKMGTYIGYCCDECGFAYEHNKEIFWIDEELKLSQKFFEINKYANDILTKSRDKKIASLARKIINLT